MFISISTLYPEIMKAVCVTVENLYGYIYLQNCNLLKNFFIYFFIMTFYYMCSVIV